MEWYAACLALGAFTGFFAGLFGIGGGLVMVPVLLWLFEAQNVAQAMHLALGTSMAAILYTAASSAHAHHAHGAVNLAIVRNLTPWLLTGTLLGTLLASHVPVAWLTLFFALFVYFAGCQMLFGFRPKPSRQLPGRFGIGLAGTMIGAISSLVSIGGGVLSVPFMTLHNVPLREAIGTSSALGFYIALGGTAGYVTTGMLLHEGLPGSTLGFVHLPALFLLAAGSVFTTPLGARLAHRLPVEKLRRGFALLLFALATRMLLKLF